MTLPSSVSRLTLVIDNPQALQLGGAPTHCFDRAGGSIGSSASSWMLYDRAGGVEPRHCEILYEDNGFVVVDSCGQTRLNGQSKPMRRGEKVRLRDADTLHIGPYSLSIQLSEEAYALPDPARVLAQHTLDELLERPGGYLNDLPQPPTELEQTAYASRPDWDEYQALAMTDSSCGQLDPLSALDQALAVCLPATARFPLSCHDYGSCPPPSQADVSSTQLEAVHGRPVSGQEVNLMPEQGSEPGLRQSLRGNVQ